MYHIGEKREDVSQLKREVRKNILAKRDKIPAADKMKYDAAIKEMITVMTEYREAKVILAYVSYQSEVDTLMLIRQALSDGKYVFAPKVSGIEMEFWQIKAIEDLQEGYRGIPEPEQSISFFDWMKEEYHGVNICTDTVSTELEDSVPESCKVMMWMPGTAFDTERHRIGYGGGFYDKYLNRLSEQATSLEVQNGLKVFILTTIALAYSSQVLEEIPYEEHDRKPDLLITEQGIYR